MLVDQINHEPQFWSEAAAEAELGRFDAATDRIEAGWASRFAIEPRDEIPRYRRNIRTRMQRTRIVTILRNLRSVVLHSGRDRIVGPIGHRIGVYSLRGGSEDRGQPARPDPHAPRHSNGLRRLSVATRSSLASTVLYRHHASVSYAAASSLLSQRLIPKECCSSTVRKGFFISFSRNPGPYDTALELAGNATSVPGSTAFKERRNGLNGNRLLPCRSATLFLFALQAAPEIPWEPLRCIWKTNACDPRHELAENHRQAPVIGCFRLVNDDVVDLGKRVQTGTAVVVLN